MNNLQNLFIFATGAAVGAGVTYIVLKEKYKFLEEDLEAYKAAEAFLNESDYETEEVDEEPINRKEPRPLDNVSYAKVPLQHANRKNKEDLDVVVKERLGKMKTDVSNYIDTTIPFQEDSPPDGMPKAEEGYNNSYLPPTVITLEEFTDEKDHFDKLTINYYAEDDTLVDEREDIITNVNALIGEDALLCFGESSDDPDVVYVRNERLSIDYEVIRINKSYQETVLGIKKPQVVKKTSKKKAENLSE